ncbi:hypothetical protein K2Z84_04480 [Candidatus Binatia bacterium]|jgi:hypothetical protein|nr:hypothetical protein [Candidatus Binatia bacterium]
MKTTIDVRTGSAGHEGWNPQGVSSDGAGASRTVPKIRLSALEWRLYLSSLLAGAYVLAWVAFAARTPRTATESVAEAAAPRGVRMTAAAPNAGFVWIDDVPIAERPAVSLPPGWAIAERPGTPSTDPVRRAADVRPRIRTRSS